MDNAKRKIGAALERLFDTVEFTPEFKKAFDRHGRFFTSRLVRERLSGRPGLKRGTGDLARSTDKVVKGRSLRSLSMQIRVGRGLKYAAIHEYGGVIKSKGKKLTIPMPAIMTAGGVQRFTLKSLKTLLVDKIRPIKLPSGSVFLAARFKSASARAGAIGRRAMSRDLVERSGRRTVLLFHLVDRVKIPSRLGARDLWESPPMVSDRQKRVTTAIARALRRAKFK